MVSGEQSNNSNSDAGGSKGDKESWYVVISKFSLFSLAMYLCLLVLFVCLFACSLGKDGDDMSIMSGSELGAMIRLCIASICSMYRGIVYSLASFTLV